METEKSLKSASTGWPPTNKLGAFGATESWAIDRELNLRLGLRVILPTTLIIARLSSLLFSKHFLKVIWRELVRETFTDIRQFIGRQPNSQSYPPTWWPWWQLDDTMYLLSKWLSLFPKDYSWQHWMPLKFAQNLQLVIKLLLVFFCV